MTTIIDLCLQHGTDTVLEALQAITTRRAELEARDIPADLVNACQSDAELRFLEYAYPVFPEIQAQHRVNGFIADFALPDLGLLIEVDGRQWHGSPEAFARDRHRDRSLVGCGWRVLRFAAREVYEDATGCVAEVMATPEPLPFGEGLE